MSQVEAIEELKRNTGTQFDPVVVEVFLKLYS
jgi:HD-GYP domain-containing protein (c-di-GMP phosphodiesterase class II)